MTLADFFCLFPYDLLHTWACCVQREKVCFFLNPYALYLFFSYCVGCDFEYSVNRWWWQRCPCLVPLGFSPLSIITDIGFLKLSFSVLRKSPSLLSFLKHLMRMRVKFFRWFSASIEIIIIITRFFSALFFNMVNYMDFKH